MGVSKAIAPQKYPDARYIYGGPTWEQSRRIFWKDLKQLVPRWALLGQDPKKAISEGELVIRLMSGATIQVVGLDRPQRAEGTPIDWLCVDEAADVREEAWTDHLRPGLSERGGQAWLASTPEGRNWLWRMAQQAQEDTTGLWSFHTWHSSTVLPAEEIAIAKAELDERTFQQEFEASFLDVSGRVYYGFDRNVHVEAIEYDPESPLFLCLDFNVAPGVAVIAQEQMYTGTNPAVDRTKPVTVCLSEVWIKDNSTTVRVTEAFLSRYRDHEGDVHLYCDASGGARGSAKVQGSDWVLVKKVLDPVFGAQVTRMTGGKTLRTPSRIEDRVPSSNPSVRNRINAMNTRLRSVDGTVRMMIDPSCKHLIEDLEAVTWNATGDDIDKKGNPMLSHLSDGLGYMIAERHPLEQKKC